MLIIKDLTIKTSVSVLVEKLSLSVAPGEVLTITGASGSGKSTVLNWMIGDLDTQFSATGELWLNDKRVDSINIEARKIGLLFQDDLLFPHMSVGQNLAFAMPSSIHGSNLRRQCVEHTLEKIDMAGFHDRDPATLSGGQRARVSLMRTLLSEPEALLLDEPFSKLDAVLRNQFRSFVFTQVGLLGIPTLLVTHDIADLPHRGRQIDLSK